MNWLIELVSLDESKAIRGLRKASRAEISPGVWVESMALSSEAEDAHETPVAELIRVGEKLKE